MSGLHITQKALDKHKLSIEEGIILLVHFYNVDMNNTFAKLIEKKFISKKYFNNKPTDDYFMMDSGVSAIEDLLLDSEESMPSDTRINDLAIKLQGLYPEGKKYGTNYYWRGNLPDIIKKLKKFFRKYGEHTDEQIIAATSKYLKSFRNNNVYMQLLKYFILKNSTSTGGDEVSELMNYIENEGATVGALDSDWTSKLK